MPARPLPGVRRLILLTRDEDAHLKRLARRTRRSITELIRLAVDDYVTRELQRRTP